MARGHAARVQALEARLAWYAENQQLLGASDDLIAEQVGPWLGWRLRCSASCFCMRAGPLAKLEEWQQGGGPARQASAQHADLASTLPSSTGLPPPHTTPRPCPCPRPRRQADTIRCLQARLASLEAPSAAGARKRVRELETQVRGRGALGC
jgi:hypothetical protein